MAEIQIVPVGDVEASTLEFLALALPETFGAACLIANQVVDPEPAFSVSRSQYNSTEILARLLDLDHKKSAKVLGVTDVDLFIPILTFVFGEAQLGGRAALVSTHRLRQQFYGLPLDEPLFYERCEKEAVHELGHAAGLVHCKSFECVMHFSNSIEAVDMKSPRLCSACADFLSRSQNVASQSF